MNTSIARTLRFFFPFAVSMLPLAGCASSPDEEESATAADALSEDACPDTVPAALTPAADQNLYEVFDAEGVQIYSCNANSTGAAWVFVAPRADLLNDGGQQIGTHYAGPTWEANDGSTVVGAKQAGVTVDATAVPWLLLTAKSHGTIDGRFSDVSTIQRLETAGGNAPSTGCDASHVGATAEVPYTARYAMYKTKPNGPVHQCAAD